MKTSLLAALVLVILSFTDATFTAINIAHWGMGVEWNPIMRQMIEHFGMWSMFAFKGFAGTFLVYLLWRTPEQNIAGWVTPILFWMVGVYSVIVFYGYCLLTTAPAGT